MDHTSTVSILQNLISFKTISGQSNLLMLDYLEHWAKRFGFRCTRIFEKATPDRANLLCEIGPSAPGGLMLSGHTDVVPVAGQKWSSDPFCLKEESDRFIGRGTADMKGFIAATCFALQNLDLKRLKRPLSLLWTYDEETGAHGASLAARKLIKHMAILPEAAIIGEPTSFKILRKHAGHVTVKISVKGKGAHSSDPSLGISAIKALSEILHGIFMLETELRNELIADEHFKRPFVTMNVGVIEGGSAVNIIPDEASAIIGFRPLPQTSIEALMARIRGTAQHYCKTPGAVITVNQELVVPAMVTKANTRLEQTLLPLAKPDAQVAAAFATDAGHLNKLGIECLIFGPGSIDVAHQANEWILKSDLDDGVSKISRVIEEYLF